MNELCTSKVRTQIYVHEVRTLSESDFAPCYPWKWRFKWGDVVLDILALKEGVWPDKKSIRIRKRYVWRSRDGGRNSGSGGRRTRSVELRWPLNRHEQCTWQPAMSDSAVNGQHCCSSQYFTARSSVCSKTRFLMSMGQSPWDNIKILGHCSVSICVYVCLCVQSGTISKFCPVPSSSKSVYSR